MSQVTEREAVVRRAQRRPAEVASARPRRRAGGVAAVRVLGALALLAVGAVHLEQYFAVHFHVVPVIGPLFALNFVGATLLALVLLLPLGRLGTAAHALAALAGIGLALTSLAFLLVSERRPLFGFMDHGYRPAIVAALAAEGAAAALLAGYLAARARAR